MRIAISAPIKKDFQKEAEALFPDCQLLWMEDLPKRRGIAPFAPPMSYSHTISWVTSPKKSSSCWGIRVWYRRRGRASTICLWQHFLQT